MAKNGAQMFLRFTSEDGLVIAACLLRNLDLAKLQGEHMYYGDVELTNEQVVIRFDRDVAINVREDARGSTISGVYVKPLWRV